jgi:putative solute:sodium symporter small subunit
MSGKQEISKTVADNYWRANISLLVKLLAVWFLVSFGAGILFVDFLNQFYFFGFKLGFWFAQQGSILVFVILIFIYSYQMHRLEEAFHIDDDFEPDSYDLPDVDTEGEQL